MEFSGNLSTPSQGISFPPWQKPQITLLLPLVRAFCLTQLVLHDFISQAMYVGTVHSAAEAHLLQL
jgi:hypothetical protein